MAEPSLGGLPSELYCEITAFLLLDGAVGSVAALAQCTRRLCQSTLPMLYDSAGRENLKAGQNGLIWAAENDEMGTLKALLESGVDPNARFWSALPDCVRQDVLAAQKLHRRLSPRLDGHLVARILREDIVWHPKCIGAPDSNESRFYRAWYRTSISGDIPESLPVRAWGASGRADHGVDELIRTARFDCRGNLDDVELLRSPYSWTALHVATKWGNTQAVEALLAHGADIEARCQGLCDCLAPLPIVPGHPERPSTCSALHIATCSGNELLVRLLLDRGANYLAVGEVDLGVQRVAGAPARSITALHTAAWGGNVAVCQLLHDRHAADGPNEVRDVLRREDARGLTALDYAIAAGHVRTTGSWLLEHQLDARVDHLQRADLHDYFLTPLNFLCYWGQYRDARLLLDRLQCTPPDYCDALELCFVRLRANVPRFTKTRASLPVYLGKYMETAVSKKPPPYEHDGEEALVCLVKQLLALGADPNSRLDVSMFPSSSDFMTARATSALHLAATHGQRAAVEVLLDAGGLLELRCPLHTGMLGPTPLRAAMIPPPHSRVTNNPRAHLETIITLLERGASFANTVPDDVEPKTDPIGWLVPLFENRSMTDTWYNAGLFDLFERIMELAAKQQGEDHVPDEWAADLVYVAITYGSSVAGFCKWLVQRYSVTPAQVTARHPNKPSLGHLLANAYCFREPELLAWVLDFAPQTAAEMLLNQGSIHPALRCINRNAMGCAKVLVERGLADQMPEGDASGNTPQMLLQDRFRTIIFEACKRFQNEDAADLVDAVITRALSLPLGDISNLLVLDGEPAISKVIRLEGRGYTGEVCHPEAERVLKVLLKHPVSLYGVKGRVHGERPSVGEDDPLIPKKHKFVYPVPIAVDLGRADLLELIFNETAQTAPPSPDDILEVLAMALDASKLEPDPAVVRAILENTTADASALIPRPMRTLDNKTDTTNRVPPLYHLLKTFYNAHISPPRRDIFYYPTTKSSSKARATHDCKCAIITRDAFLVDSIALLLRHGASWRQPCEPSGETPLDVLAAILDGKDCDAKWGDWPAHNLATLRRHVKLDWRASADVEGEVMGEGFNPVEVRKLGVEARWG